MQHSCLEMSMWETVLTPCPRTDRGTKGYLGWDLFPLTSDPYSADPVFQSCGRLWQLGAGNLLHLFWPPCTVRALLSLMSWHWSHSTMYLPFLKQLVSHRARNKTWINSTFHSTQAKKLIYDRLKCPLYLFYYMHHARKENWSTQEALRSM